MVAPIAVGQLSETLADHLEWEMKEFSEGIYLISSTYAVLWNNLKLIFN